MLGKRGASLLSAGLICAVAGIYLVAAEKSTLAQRREQFTKAHRDGNYKVAYEGLRRFALDPGNDPARVGDDLHLAIACLKELGRTDEIDDFRETVIAAWPKNWRLLHKAAVSFTITKPEGYIVAGKFYRGSHRESGQPVSASERDRARALQLFARALPLAAKDVDKNAVAQLHFDFARTIRHGTHSRAAWRLQYLTDLATLPDYEEEEESEQWRGAAVDVRNKPIYYSLSRSFKEAANDGERWRWLLAATAELNPKRASEVDWVLASFWRGRFSVRTLGWDWASQQRTASEQKTSTLALSTLRDTETVANLATGVQRFTLPDEFNWIKIFQRIAERGKGPFGERARDALAQEYEDRLQYVKAAAAWRKAIAEYGGGDEGWRRERLDQIVGNRGRFEGDRTLPAGQQATIGFRFRNGKKVAFEAHTVKVDQLLADAKNQLKTGIAANREMNIRSLCDRLLTSEQKKYLGAKVATWALELKPRPAHRDERITVNTPLKKPGAYLLTAKMAEGNISTTLVLLTDTVLVKKQLDGKVFYFVADARTGKPIAKADLAFLGYGYKRVKPNDNEWRLTTRSFTRSSDSDGQVILTEAEAPRGYSWLVIARKETDGIGGTNRFACLEILGQRGTSSNDTLYNAIKVLTITDRPVYRPGHKVHFKNWIRHAKYDQPNTSDFANKRFDVVIINPAGDQVYNLPSDNMTRRFSVKYHFHQDINNRQ